MGKKAKRRAVRRADEVKGTDYRTQGCSAKEREEEESERSQQVVERSGEDEREIERAIEDMLNECQREAQEKAENKKGYNPGGESEGKNDRWARRAGEGRREDPPRQREGVSNPQAWAVDSAIFVPEENLRAVQGRRRGSPSLHADLLHDWI